MRFVRCFAPPHDNPPSLAGEGDSIPQHKSKHTSRAHGDTRQGRQAQAQGGGKRNLHLVFRGRWTSARGPSHTPFGGVRNLANTYRRCGANWAPPYNSYFHSSETHPGEGRSLRLQHEVRDLKM
eukprot:scaffold5365_cov115-Isochrysis_galbana.AAC.10